MPLVLSTQQSEALIALDWLFSGEDRHRRTGRTHVLAVAYLRKAIREAGEWVEVEDHAGTLQADQYMLRSVHALAEEAGVMIDTRRNRFRVEHVTRSAVEWLNREVIVREVSGLGPPPLTHLVSRPRPHPTIQEEPQVPVQSSWERLLAEGTDP